MESNFWDIVYGSLYSNRQLEARGRDSRRPKKMLALLLPLFPFQTRIEGHCSKIGHPIRQLAVHAASEAAAVQSASSR